MCGATDKELEAFAYALEKCGFMVTAATRHRFTKRELAKWDRAVDEYLRGEPPLDR